MRFAYDIAGDFDGALLANVDALASFTLKTMRAIIITTAPNVPERARAS